MTVRDNNLYQNGRVFVVDGEELLLRDTTTVPRTVFDQYITVRDDDTLDKLAWRAYEGEAADPSKYWWLLADANNIQNPLDITELVGREIVVPDFQQALLHL